MKVWDSFYIYAFVSLFIEREGGFSPCSHVLPFTLMVLIAVKMLMMLRNLPLTPMFPNPSQANKFPIKALLMNGMG